jgi:hypothetical protein
MLTASKINLNIFITTLALLCAAFVALVSSQQAIGALVLFGSIFGSVLVLSLWYLRGAQSGDLFVYISIACLFALPFIQKITGQRLIGLWQIALVFGGLMGIPVFLRHAKNQPLLRLSLILFTLYFSWAICSNMVSGRFNAYAFLYQFISNLKPVLLISFSFFAWDRLSSHRMMWVIVDNCIWLLLAMVAFEWLLPSIYYSIFSAYSISASSYVGIFPSRATGPFEHPSFLASVAACFAMLTSAKVIYETADRRKYTILTMGYMVCLLFSVQRQELIGAIAAIFIMIFIARKVGWSIWHLLAIVGSLLLGVGFVAIFGNDIYREAGMWGLGTVSEISHPRAQQYAAAFLIAKDNFPFGTGLGTYGGAGAEKFDLSLYYEMGFGRYWWFGKQDYLLDTYWPNSIAEGGWIGFVLLLSHYIVLGLYAVRNARNEEHSLAATYWLFAGLGVWFLIVNAFSSPSFQDPRLYFWVAMAMAMAHYTKTYVRHE